MRVGTLTFHRVNNFGAVLQAYALQNYIIGLGYDTEIIDYNPFGQSDNYKVPKVKKVIKYLKEPRTRLYARITNEKFRRFREENLLLSKKEYIGDESIKLDPPIYDYYVVGSDQIWNTELSNKSKAFYLHFVNSGKKISYAASFGKDYFNENENKYITDYLREFDCLSVREKYHAQLLENTFKINATVTLDPVFLLNKLEWGKLEKPIKKLPNKYVLMYVLEASNELFECAQKKSDELGCELICISLVPDKIYGQVLRGIGPAEFLYIFSNALYICTNSFHGTAFSIIFNKDFSVVKHRSRNSRIDNILGILELRERYYNASNQIYQNNIDYDSVNRRLNSVIEQSKRFIANSMLTQ